jgi:hypothetical protein
MYSNDITRTKYIDSCWEKPQEKEEKEYPVKELWRINIPVCFFLYQANNGKERQNWIVQRHEKQCA